MSILAMQTFLRLAFNKGTFISVSLGSWKGFNMICRGPSSKVKCVSAQQ